MRSFTNNIRPRQLGEVVRQEAGGCLVCGSSEFREHPGNVALRVDTQEFAGGHDAVNHRGQPAGFGVSVKESVAQADFGGPEEAFDWALVDEDVFVAGREQIESRRAASAGCGA